MVFNLNYTSKVSKNRFTRSKGWFTQKNFTLTFILFEEFRSIHRDNLICIFANAELTNFCLIDINLGTF